MANPISRWWKRRKSKWLESELNMLRDRIQVEYRDNQIWLTCDGTAVFIFSETTPAAEIAEVVEESRRAAVAFRYHIPIADDSEQEANVILETTFN